MKTFLILLSTAAMAQAAASAQTPEPFFPSKTGTVLEYVQRDGKSGETLMFTTDSIAGFSGDFRKGGAKVISTVRYPGDTLTVSAAEPMKFENYEVISDFATAMEESLGDMVKQSLSMAGADETDMAEVDRMMDEVTVSGECRGIPADLSVGMELPDYNVEVKIMFVSTKASCKDRKVVAQETVTTPAGTFDCYVVEEKSTVKTMMASAKNDTRTWYARGIGMVRQEVWARKKLVSVTELTAVR